MGALKDFVRSRLNESAEALPVAIVTAIVSSILMLGLAGVTGQVVQGQKSAMENSSTSNSATVLQSIFAADINAATAVSAAGAEITFMSPSLGSADVCRVTTWRGTEAGTVERSLTLKAGFDTSSGAGCDLASGTLAESTQIIASGLTAMTLTYTNQVGRELVADGAFDGDTAFVTPGECAQGLTSGAGCVTVEPAVQTAWDDTTLASVQLAFTLANSEGFSVSRVLQENVRIF